MEVRAGIMNLESLTFIQYPLSYGYYVLDAAVKDSSIKMFQTSLQRRW